MTLKADLNRLAGTSDLEVAGAANSFAGTSGLELQGALNARLGTTGLGVQACLNRIAGLAAGTKAEGSALANAINVHDSFTRANNASSLGSANTGQTWTQLLGTWGISSNQAYISASAGQIKEAAVIQSGKSDVTVQVKIAASGGNPGILLRAADVDNGLATNPTALFRLQAGGYTSILTFSTAISVGDTLRLTAVGSNITAYRQAGSTGSFSSIGSITEAFGQTNTKHGLRSDTNTANATRFDDFRIFTPTS
jgi:hypothetical protein